MELQGFVTNILQKIKLETNNYKPMANIELGSNGVIES
jgi:hypothetical protein